jgi:hypothetical protein
MSAPNPLSYNAWVVTVGALAVEVVTVPASPGVNSFANAPLQALLPQILAFAEGRIQRDLDLLSSQTSNLYTLTAGVNVFPLPVVDFQTVQTLEIVQLAANGAVVNSFPLTPASKEFIQNCYAGLTNAGMPKWFAMYGDAFGGEQDSVTNILLGPAPSFGFSVRVTGTAYEPSLFTNASNGIADTQYTYISNYYPDLLVAASMIFISGYQRNWSAVSDDPKMAQSYENQYQLLKAGAIEMENRRKFQGSAWSAYSTPPAATPTR